eukprot:GGOE01002180.1.p1 GENE.GGOE01002180.1~~GGOE01002180.1.p1  ORF type:complete len:745 (-),score=147.64 GGOE01002180.1:620-2707(-)
MNHLLPRLLAPGAMGVSSRGTVTGNAAGFLTVGPFGIGPAPEQVDSLADYGNVYLTPSNYQLSDLSPSCLHSLLREDDLHLFNSLTSNHDSNAWCMSSDFDGFALEKVATELVPVPADKPPKQVGRYLLGSVLGEGTYSKVREGIHMTTLARVAVKVMKKRQLWKVKGGIANVEAEILIMRQLSQGRPASAHVLGLREVIRSNRKIHLVMDCALASLQHLIDCQYYRRFSEPVASLVFQQVLMGLSFLHSQSVVHKDIKPSNIMVMPDGTIKIADLGVAEVVSLYSPAPRCDRMHGSPAFQCPQIASAKEPFNGFKADIWSAGVTLFLLLLGRLPFTGRTLYQLYENICTHHFTPGDVSELATQLLQGMLDKDEGDRWTADECLRWPWVANAALGPWQLEDQYVVCCPESHQFAKTFSPYHQSSITGILSGASGDVSPQSGVRSSSSRAPNTQFAPTGPSSPTTGSARSSPLPRRDRYTPDGLHRGSSSSACCSGGDLAGEPTYMQPLYGAPSRGFSMGTSQGSQSCSSVSTLMDLPTTFWGAGLPAEHQLRLAFGQQSMARPLASGEDNEDLSANLKHDRRMQEQMEAGDASITVGLSCSVGQFGNQDPYALCCAPSPMKTAGHSWCIILPMLSDIGRTVNPPFHRLMYHTLTPQPIRHPLRQRPRLMQQSSLQLTPVLGSRLGRRPPTQCPAS